MALTITEQLKLSSGEVKPPNNQLMVLVHHSALVTAKKFYDNYKEFDPMLIPEAQSYLTKLFSICDRVLRKDTSIIQQLLGISITIIGTSKVTFAELVSFNDEAWEKIVLDNMTESFEYLAGVKKSEKKIYREIEKPRDKAKN